MGSKTKLTDTSGKRIPKKPKINETDISVTTNGELFLNENPISGGDGTPSAPNGSIQYNNAGAFFGDALFTRDPVTNNTTISQNFGGNELGLFQLDGSNVDLLYTNTITGEGAGMNFNNSSGVEAQLAYNDGANQFNNLVFNTNSTTLTWDADTTDTIITKLEQSQDILGLAGLSGSALTWQDTGTEIVGFVGAGDASGSGLFPGTAIMGTSSLTTGASAIIATNYDNVNNIAVAIAYIANGDFESGFSFDDTNALIQYKNGTTGLQSAFEASVGSAIMRYTSSGITEYQTVLGDGIFQILDSTNNINYLIIDIINSSMTINPTLVPTYADDAEAVVSGLTSGQLYKTTTGGSTFLKIVP